MSTSETPGDSELPLLIGAGDNRAEALLLIGAPRADGTVHVRRWSGADWSAPAEARAEPAEVLLVWIERQAAVGRSLNQSLYAVQRWLRGGGTASR